MSRSPSDAETLFADSLVIDAAAPILMQDSSQWRRYADSGVNATLATLTIGDDPVEVLRQITGWYALAANHPRLKIAESVQDLKNAHVDGDFSLVFHFQNAAPLGRDVARVEVFRRLGVRVMQLTYNYRNSLGDGSFEPENAGLSAFGRAAVKRMNAEGVLVDCSHTGVRTTLDAIEVSQRPIAITHANARAVHDHPRNVTDEQLDALSESGGVVGVCAYCAFVTDQTNTPTVDDLVAHLDYIVQRIGIDHVGVGVDYYDDRDYRANVDSGIWPSDYAAPPWHWPVDGTDLNRLAQNLQGRGYADADIRKVLGGNFLRLFQDSWGA